MKTNLQAKKALSALAAVAAVVATGSVRADEVAVGTGETHTFTNASDRVQTEAVRLADRATLVHLGTGTTTLQTGTFVENTASASLAVRAGTVRLTASEPSVTSYPEPTDVLAKAAFWVDAANAASLAMREGTTDEVETWRDARETGDGTDGSPYAYTRAVAFTNDWLTAFPQLKELSGKTGVWFRECGSGCFMNWLKPDGTQQNLTGIRHVFVVHAGDDKGIGDFLGQRLNATAAYFERVGSGGYGYNLPMWPTIMNGSLGASRVYLNGEEVDKYTTYYSPSTVYTVEVEALNESLGAMCFFNDRDMQVTATDKTKVKNADGQLINVILGNTSWTIGGDRAGGGYLFEVVVFTNDLTAAERLAVSDWLNQKWRDVLPPSGAPKLAVSVASGAAVEIGAGALAAGSPVTGDGTLVKTGDDVFVLPTAAEPHNASLRLDVRGGSVRLDGDVPLVCKAGDTLVSERGLDGVEVSAPTAGADATRLVKSGSGPVTLDAVPDGVTRIDVTAGELRLADPEAASGILPTAAETIEVAFPDPGFETYRGTSHTWAFKNLPTDGTTLYGWGAAKTKDGGDFAAFYDQGDHSVDYFGMTLQSPPSGVLFVKGNAHSAWCEIEVPSDGEYELSCRAAPRNSDYLGTHVEFVVGDTLDEALADAGARVSFGALTTTEDKWKTFRLGRQRLTKGTKVFCLKNVSTASDPGTQFDDFRLVRVSDAGLWELPNGGFEARTASFNANSFCLANAACVANYAITQAEGSSDIPTTFAPKGVKDGDNYRFNQPWNRADSETQLFMSGAGCTLTTTFTPPAGTWWFRADFSDWGGKGYKIAASAAIGDRTVDLGSVTPASNALVTRLWPKAFSADGATAVTLTLTGAFAAETQTSGYGILDNLALVRAPASLFRANADDLEVAFPDPGFETYRGTSHTWAFKNLPTDGTTLYGWGAAKTKDGGDFAAFYDQGDNSVAYYGMTLQSPPSGVLFVKGNAHSAWCEIEVPSDGEYELSCRAAPRNSDYLGTHVEFVVGDTLEDALAEEGARVSFGALTTTEDKWKTFRLGRQRLTKGTKVFCLKNVSTASDPGTQFDDFRLVRATEAGPLVLPSGDFEVVNDGAVFESVTFSEGGLYRLAASCASKAASGSDGTPDLSTVGRNPVAFYLASDGVTNWVGCTDAALTTNFCEYAYLLQIPEGGGTWDVGFKGTVAKADASAADRTMLVDSARLYRVETDGFVSGLSEDLEIVAAKGAKLTLDFAGTNAISRLRVGGRSYSGFVSLALRPELLGTLSGRGTLYVKPRGGVFIVR